MDKFKGRSASGRQKPDSFSKIASRIGLLLFKNESNFESELKSGAFPGLRCPLWAPIFCLSKAWAEKTGRKKGRITLTDDAPGNWVVSEVRLRLAGKVPIAAKV